jgi:adenine-specific DNA-methyltransferase
MSTSYLTSLLERLDQADEGLGRELRKEIKRITDSRKCGLVFEHHVPETVELPGRKVRRGVKVCINGDSRTWLVTRVSRAKNSQVAALVCATDPELACDRPVGDLMVIAEFGDPIYPGLKSLGRIKRGGDKPFHSVIKAENFHALEALLYPYRGMIDCVLIDPPYNSGEESWVYSDRFVDTNDSFADSMWLSFMNRRLLIAKELLSKDGVLAIHINEKEVNNLGVLLKQTFPRARLNMLTVRVAGAGQSRDGLSRVDEQVFIAFLGNALPNPISALVGEKARKRGIWDSMSGTGMQNQRPQRSPTMAYPIFINKKTGALMGAGKHLTQRLESGMIPEIRNDMSPPPVPEAPKTAAVIWATSESGELFGWRLKADTLMEQWKRGYIKVVPARKPEPGREFVIKYLASGTIKKVESGAITIVSTGTDKVPTLQLRYEGDAVSVPGTMWTTGAHSTTMGGDSLVDLFGYKPFSYPKSPYLSYDLLSVLVGGKKDALVLDFFAGSGTTQHALSMLNAADEGRRTSIMVTNNQVDKKTTRALIKRGVHPGTPEFEAEGIFEKTTRARVEFAMTGERDNEPIEGEYLAVGGNDPRLIADGFAENVEFFELTYEDPERVRLDMAFQSIAPLLWMHAGARGDRIGVRSDDFTITEHYGILFDPDKWREFTEALEEHPDVRCVYVVTDSDPTFQAVVGSLPPGVEPLRLYESYLTAFEINRWVE